MCPKCKSETAQIKKGSYRRISDDRQIPRFKCKACSFIYSATHFSIEYRLRKREINQEVFFLLCSGMSQRRCARRFDTKPETIARRLTRFGLCGENNLEVYRKSRAKVSIVQLDEIESFEHTKCKPLTMPIAVEQNTRMILSLRVGNIAAKGHLAKKSVAKYGKRDCERKKCLDEVLEELKTCCIPDVIIKSDKSKHYPKPFQSHFPTAIHKAYKGRRGCVVGQGELKAGGYDPIFSLNHTYAMIRDNIKRLSRRTWCTTKRLVKLQAFLFMYAWFHNLWVEKKKQPIELTWLPKNI